VIEMEWIGTKAVAEILGVSVSTVQRMANNHRLFAVRIRVINGRRRFNRRDIEWFAEIRTARV
jgi:excisionase family DNA binding protein